MILVNIPFVIGWLTLHQASSVTEIFIGFLILGLAVGLMEAPVVTYLGEIWYKNSTALIAMDFRFYTKMTQMCERFFFFF